MTEQTDSVVRIDEGDEPPAGHRVVVGVDCSAGSRAALLFALEDAARRGVPVDVVSAYRLPEYWVDFDGVGTDEPERLRTMTLEQTKAFVESVLPDVPQRPPEIRVRTAMGPTADVLTRESHGADLLVVGSRGRGGFASMLLGSVSIQCAMHASCPVTVVHSPEAHQHRLHLRRHRHAEVAPETQASMG